MKTCNRCHRELELTEFHRNCGMPDGLNKQCKDCRCAYQRIYSKTAAGRAAERRRPQRRTQRPTREQRAAHKAIETAIRNGSVQRPDECGRCGKRCTVHGHHADHEDRLTVEWLCPMCHAGENPNAIHQFSLFGLVSS